MNWLARLKAENSSPTHATNATTTPNVAFVALSSESICKKQPLLEVARPKQTINLVRAVTEATDATNTQDVAFVASPFPEKVEVQALADPDNACWPYSQAMSIKEIGLFIFRLEQFTRKGVSLADAEMLADRLVQRDRDWDDRHLCMECLHLQGDVSRWRCANAHAARMAVGVANAPLPGGLTQQLQHCPGFTPTPLLKGI